MNKKVLNKIIALVLISLCIINIILPTSTFAISEDLITDVGVLGEGTTPFVYDKNKELNGFPANIVRFRVPTNGKYTILKSESDTLYYSDIAVFKDTDLEDPLSDNLEDGESELIYIDGGMQIERAFNLRAGRDYYIVVNEGWEGISVKTTETISEGGHDVITETDAVEESNNKSKASDIEQAITWLLINIGRSIKWLIEIVAGSGISLDTLIFDRYPNTRLSLFNDLEGKMGVNPFFGGSVRSVLNIYFTTFRNLAILVYIIVLVYMGIKVLLDGTAGGKAKWKDDLIYWLKGIAILFIFPYVIKYTIMINWAIVTYIDENQDASLSSISPMLEAAQSSDLASVPDMTENDADLESKTDYISVMEKRAQDEGWAVYAICFIVMWIQVITFLIIYVKRLLTVIFLIAIFPLVTMTYAIDKAGDGKSQAFDSWFKEFYLNVFLQTFHAINYVIVMSIVLAIGTNNWILILVGITYITKGEEILRGLFGQVKGGGAGTVTSAVKNAAMAAAYANVAKSSISKVKSTFGKGGVFTNINDARRNLNIAKMDKKSAKYDIQTARSNQTIMQGNISNAIGTALSNSSTGIEQKAALDTLRRASISNNYSGEFDKQIGNLSGEQRKELSNLMKFNSALDTTQAQDLNINLKQQIEVTINAISKGGKYAEIAAAAGVTKEGLEKLYKQYKITNAVKIDAPSNRVYSLKTLPKGGKYKIDKDEAARRRKQLSKEREKGRARAAEGKFGERTVRRVGVSRRIGNAKTEERISKGVISKKESFREEGGAPEYVERKHSNQKRKVMEKRAKRAVVLSRVADETDKYLEKGTRSNSIVEANRKFGMMPPTEAASYESLASNIAILNQAENGGFSIEELHEAHRVVSEESKKGFEYTENIAKNLDYNLDDLETVLARETINNSDRISGTVEERQKYIDDSIDVLQRASESGKEIDKIILSDLQMPIETLKKGHMPIEHGVHDEKRGGVIEREYEKTVEDCQRQYEIEKLKVAEAKMEYLRTKTQGVVQVATTVAAGIIVPTSILGSGGKVKDAATAAIASSVAVGGTASTITGNIGYGVTKATDFVTKRSKRLEELQEEQSAVTEYSKRVNRNDVIQKIQGRDRVIYYDDKGKGHIQDTKVRKNLNDKE